MQQKFHYKSTNPNCIYKSKKLKRVLRECLNKLWNIHMIEYDSPQFMHI